VGGEWCADVWWWEVGGSWVLVAPCGWVGGSRGLREIHSLRCERILDTVPWMSHGKLQETHDE